MERLPEDEQYFIHSADIADRVKVIFDFYVTSDLSEVTSSIFTKINRLKNLHNSYKGWSSNQCSASGQIFMQVFFFSWKCHILYEGKNTWNQPIPIIIIILTAPNWIICFFRNGIIQMSFFKELWKNIFCFQGSWVLGPSIANYHTQLEGEQD